MKLLIIAMVPMLMMARGAWCADVVTETAGTTISGQIVSEDDKTITIKSVYETVLLQQTISKVNVKAVQRDKPENAKQELASAVARASTEAAVVKAARDSAPPSPPSAPPQPDAWEQHQQQLAGQMDAVRPQLDATQRRVDDARTLLSNLTQKWNAEGAQIYSEYFAAMNEPHPTDQYDYWATRAREHYEQKTEELRSRYQPQVTQAQMAIDAATKDRDAIQEQARVLGKRMQEE